MVLFSFSVTFCFVFFGFAFFTHFQYSSSLRLDIDTDFLCGITWTKCVMLSYVCICCFFFVLPCLVWLPLLAHNTLIPNRFSWLRVPSNMFNTFFTFFLCEWMCALVFFFLFCFRSVYFCYRFGLVCYIHFRRLAVARRWAGWMKRKKNIIIYRKK